MSGHGRIVVGFSESLPGLQALRFAVAEARRCGVALHAVRAWPIPPPTWTSAGFVWREDLTAETRRFISDAFDAALGGLPDDVTVTMAWFNGRIDTALMQTVSKADVLVLGTPASWWYFSGTVRACTRGARCPVIIVPASEFARTARWTSPRQLFREIGEHS